VSSSSPRASLVACAVVCVTLLGTASNEARAAAGDDDGDAMDEAAKKKEVAPPPPLGPTVPVHHAPLPREPLDYHSPVMYPTGLWLLTQLIPSPQFAFGAVRHINVDGSIDDTPKTAFGLRWQLTPILWSFGVHQKQSRWRFFIVDPFARHSGSIEIATSFEYIGGHIDTVFARPTARVYLPLIQKGESLSFSMGTSVYRYEGFRVAYEGGLYTLAGLIGLQVTVAPAHDPLAVIATLRLRYF
jgi:hypothetical protein